MTGTHVSVYSRQGDLWVQDLRLGVSEIQTVTQHKSLGVKVHRTYLQTPENHQSCQNWYLGVRGWAAQRATLSKIAPHRCKSEPSFNFTSHQTTFRKTLTAGLFSSPFKQVCVCCNDCLDVNMWILNNFICPPCILAKVLMKVVSVCVWSIHYIHGFVRRIMCQN